jgi:hypothetical protein
VDYYPRLFSMILDQLEFVAEAGKQKDELFEIVYGNHHEIGNLEKAKEFVLTYWNKFATDGRDRKFQVVPLRF